VGASVRLGVRAVSTINQWTEFYQTLVIAVAEGADELINFEGQGVKVKVTARSNI